MFTFNTLHKDKKTRARVGKLQTSHGVVTTPAFTPVGTQATVKGLTPQDLKEIGVEILFGNTYHLHLRPGEEVIEEFGGLGKFMGWGGVTMTDSGGFQVFSLAKVGEKKSRGPVAGFPLVNAREEYSSQNNSLRVAEISSTRATPSDEETPQLVKITEDGVMFKSHLDGSVHTFTPEQSIAIQKKLGADIMLAFDQCTAYPITYEGAKADMERTHRWAVRSLETFKKKGKFDQALYGIVQGSIYQDLREQSAKFIAEQNFDGMAIGGVSVGESKREMQQSVDWVVPLLPDDKVRHLLGIGDVDDIFTIIERGIDTFDCVTPSRLGRVGHILVHPPEGNLKNRFRIDITKSLFARSSEPLSKGCSCYVCQNFTRGYIQHLFRARELLAYRLATYHNVHFIVDLVKRIREAIIEERFNRLKKQWLE